MNSGLSPTGIDVRVKTSVTSESSSLAPVPLLLQHTCFAAFML